MTTVSVPSTKPAAPLVASPDGANRTAAVLAGRWRLAPLGLVVLLAIVFFAHASSWLDAGFGESHDGRNAAVWGMASRALRHDPIGSHLGGELAPEYRYANHPPLIIGETAAAETIAGEHRIVTRAPAWLGSMVALILLCWLLLDAGLSPTAVAAGVVSVLGSAMFLVYGTMLDTPVTSLPFTLAILLAWQRARHGRPVPIPVIVSVAVLAGLAGWQSFVFTALAVTTLGIDALRRRQGWAQVLAMGAGATTGLVATFAWIHWVYGSFGPLLDNREYRSHGSGLVTTLRIQTDHLWGLAPMAIIVGVAGAVFAVRDRRVRALLGLSATAVVGYGLAFRGAAEMHDYWNYAALVPLAVGAASGFDKIIHSAAASRHTLAVVGSLLVAVACLAISTTEPASAQYALENGIGTVRLARVAESLPSAAGGPVLAYLSSGGSLSRWIDYETGRPGLALNGAADLQRLAADQPDFPVLLVLVGDSEARRRLLTDNAFSVAGPFALVPARVVAHAEAP